MVFGVARLSTWPVWFFFFWELVIKFRRSNFNVNGGVKSVISFISATRKELMGFVETIRLRDFPNHQPIDTHLWHPQHRLVGVHDFSFIPCCIPFLLIGTYECFSLSNLLGHWLRSFYPFFLVPEISKSFVWRPVWKDFDILCYQKVMVSF
jgi:hypothetical protein